MGNLIDRLRQFLFLQLATIYLRYMIGFAFVFASFIKIQGKRFTQISPDEPIGYFFEAMYSTGFYWQFLGWGQLIAGALLMTQRFATFGVVVFFPIILNVFMITHSIDFGMGTPVITTLMLLGTMYLLAWDYKKFAILFHRDHETKLDLTGIKENRFMNHPAWIVTGVIFILMAMVPWATEWKHIGLWMISMLLISVSIFVFMMMWRVRERKRVSAEQGDGMSVMI
jgi:hypothetical protein